jgi:hypothetical protein
MIRRRGPVTVSRDSRMRASEYEARPAIRRRGRTVTGARPAILLPAVRRTARARARAVRSQNPLSLIFM